MEKIAGTAARQVSGVHDLGRGSARALGALRDRLPVGGNASPAQGVSVDPDDLKPLHVGTVARIRSTGLSGIAIRYIALTPGPSNAAKIARRPPRT